MTSGFLVNNDTAYVNNGSMVRLDVYKRPNKKGKIEHFFVPVYAHMIKRGHPEIKPTKILPEPKKGTPTEVDDSFSFVCSLFPNDYVKITLGGEVKEGYYVMYGIAVGQMVLLKHSAPDKSEAKSISPRSASLIERLDINVLGDNYKWD